MDGQTAEEDFSSLSTIDKLQHKSWKARLSAYEELAQLFRKTMEDSDFYTYQSYLKKMVTDANAIIQEVALTAVLEYVSNAPNASSTREQVIPSLVEKCFGAARAGTKQKATDIVLLYAEIDQPDSVIEYIIPGTTVKQPKVVTHTVFTLKELVRQFGAKKVNPKPILKLLPKLFGHTDKNVRAEAFSLTVETYRWVGQAMMTSLSDLKPVQLKELEEAFQKLPAEKPTPERLIRAEQAMQEEQAQEEEQEGSGEQMDQDEDVDMDQDMDPYDLAEPVDITAKLPGNFFELLVSKKWQERREALDALLEQAKAPKILDKDYSELIAALAKRINDANALLVGTAANCIENIAQGLRTDFGKYKPVVAPVIVEKLKERKPAILEQLANALNSVFATVPMSELVEDITAASKHKNAQVRSECFKLVSRRLREVKEMPDKPEIKAFGEMFKKLLDDADANAREAGAEGLGTMMKLLGEKPMLAFTDGLDDIKMGKIKEFYEKVTVKAKAPKKPAAPPPKKPAAAPPAKKTASKTAPPKRKPPARLAGAASAKKPALSSKPKPAAAPAASKKGAKQPAASAPEETEYNFLEDAEGPVDISGHLNKIVAELGDANWKVRKEALDKVQGIIKGAHNSIKSSLGTEFPGVLKQRLNDTNKNLQIQAVEITGALAMAMDKSFEKHLKTFAAPVAAVLSDNKANVRAAGVATLEQFRKACGLEQMAGVFGASLANESPALRKDLLTWLNTAVPDDTNAANGDWTSLISPLFSCLQDRNADVRKAAQTFLPLLVSLVGYDAVCRKASELKASQRQTVMPLIESARGPAPASSKGGSSQMERRSETPSDDHRLGSSSTSRTKTVKKKLGLPSPRPVSQTVATAPESEPLPPMIANKQLRAKKEIARRSMEPPRHEAEFMEPEEQLPSLNKLPRLGGRSQIGKPRGLVAPQRISHHVPQNMSEPEPMEDVIDDYGQRISEETYEYQYEPRQVRSYQQQQQFQSPSMLQQQQQHQQQQQQQPMLNSNSREDVVAYLIAQITSGDPQASIEALKHFDKFITQSPDVILPDIEPLINAITLQVKLVFSSIDPRQPTSTRLCKHLVSALVLLFSNRELASAVSHDALYHLLQELAHRLLDQKMLALESGPQLSKALNVAMVKILENSNRNVTFSALLSILSNCSSGLRPGDSPAAKETKYTELIMKCLWKLAKTIRSSLQANQLNPDELLYEINRFFIMTPPTEWKRRAAENVPLGEIPLRTVKTLLLQLVTSLGDSVFQHLTLIENPQSSSVYPYLHHMLEGCRKKDGSMTQQQMQQSPTSQLQQQQQMQMQMQQSQQSEFMTHSRTSSLSRPSSIVSLKSSTMARSPSIASHRSNEGDSANSMHIDSNPSHHNPAVNNHIQPMQVDEHPSHDTPSNTLNELEMHNALQRIFAKIGTRDQTKQGIIELYEFQKAYPAAQSKVNTYLSQTGTYFQSYIRRGLSNLAAEDNEMLAASTIPMVPTTTTATATSMPATPVATVTAASSPSPTNISTATATNVQHFTATPSTMTAMNAGMTMAASVASEDQHRYSFEQQQTQIRTTINENPRPSSFVADDAADIKLRLLRLRQKFGYKNEVDDNNNNTST